MEPAGTPQQLLKAHGLRVGMGRYAIIDVLQQNVGWMTTEEIALAIAERYPVIHLSTIYRTLELFEQVGIIIRLPASERLVRWKLGGEAKYHLICHLCEGLFVLPDEPFYQLAQALWVHSQVQMEMRFLTIMGVCASCRVSSTHSEGNLQQNQG